MKRITTLLLLTLTLLNPMWCQIKRIYSSDQLSSSMFSCMVQDKSGYIWIGTEYGLNKFDGYRFTNYLHDDKVPTSVANNVIVCLYVRRNGDILIGTNKGLQRYDNKTNSFQRFKTPTGEEPRVGSIIELKNGRVLAGTEGYGLYEVNFENMTMRNINKIDASNESHYFTSLFEDRYRNLWKNGYDSNASRYGMRGGKYIQLKNYPTTCGAPVRFVNDTHGDMILICEHGIMKYLKDKDRLVNMEINSNGLNLSNIDINSGMIDCKGNIFMGSIGKGLFYIPYGSNRMLAFDNPGNSIDLTTADIRFIFQDREKNFWIGCNYKGLIYFNNAKAQFSSWNFSSQNIPIGSFVSHLCPGDQGNVWCTVQDRVYKFDKFGKITSNGETPAHTSSIYRDHKGNYWIGTDNSLYRYFPEQKSWVLEKKFRGIMINSFTDDGRGTFYLSTFSKGFCSYNTITKETRYYSMLDKDKGKGKGNLYNDWINMLFLDSSGLLWIGASEGISCFSPREQSFMHYGWKAIITNKTGISFCEDKDKNILIGTDAGLYLFNKKTRKVDIFQHSDPLRNMIICGMERDSKNNLWISTPSGIWQYNNARQRFISYIHGNGLTGKEYRKSVYMQQHDGRIFFVTNDGVTTFMPEDVGMNAKPLNDIRLTNLLIGGKAADISTLSNGEKVTNMAVDETNDFTISYLDNTFEMEFSLLQYSNAENIRFEYRINGTDDWISTDEGKNAIVFSHMQPGTYTIEVRACDQDSYSPIKTYHITISPPWYSSTIAYLIYIFLIICIGVFGLYIYNRRRHEELNEDKMRFLINATHDIRSPLTLILGPLDKLIKKGFDNETNEELNIIDRNAKRILHLVNQILDIRKIDKKQMQMRCEETPMTSYISNICKNFEYHAKECNITFTFKHEGKDFNAWIDRINFDKVVTNLLSNAFKYTHEGGMIEVELSTGQHAKNDRMPSQYMELKITDSGIGLQETKTNRIFDRFYQGDNSRNIGIQGTGIGLNLCKMIVTMHHGTIEAQNRTDAKGACFIVQIPLGKKHLRPDEMLANEEEAETDLSNKKPVNTQKYNVLVADDDGEIGTYISSELGGYYRFHSCYNGKEALAELLRNKYDIVISDVMMPEMDGFTLVKMIKANPNISHIPVLLLTSKSDIDSRLEGIEKGADAYLAKPFNMEELHLTVDNLIKNRLRLKGKYSGALKQEDKIENKQVEANDDMLMKRIMKSVNENLSNSDYSVEQMATDAGVSRAQLHRKLKDITGVSASDFVRNLRMEQAVKLLQERKINITQIAYAVGFTNEAHFSTVFKKYYGVPPSEYNNA